jgi:hypothetical protein
MSWRDLAWSGKMRRKTPEDESTGVVTSVGLNQGTEIVPARPRVAIRPVEVPAGVQVTVGTLDRPDDQRTSRVGRLRLPR